MTESEKAARVRKLAANYETAEGDAKVRLGKELAALGWEPRKAKPVDESPPQRRAPQGRRSVPQSKT